MPKVDEGDRPLYWDSLAMLSEKVKLRASPYETVSSRFGLKVCVWLMATRLASPVLGPKSQGSATFPKQFTGKPGAQEREYLAESRSLSLNRWSILMSNWFPSPLLAADPCQFVKGL